MEDFVYLVGAVFVAVTVARLMFWAVDVIEGGALKMDDCANCEFFNVKILTIEGRKKGA